jgi:hypothetical protein
MFCPIPKVLYNKNVTAIVPSSCIYKIFQSSNYDIRDFFMMRLLHKSMPLGFNGTYTKVWTTIAIPSCTSNTSDQFFAQCKMHIHYIHIYVYVQIKFKFFTSKYFYINSFPMPVGYIHGG